jgi:hypothetical protein
MTPSADHPRCTILIHFSNSQVSIEQALSPVFFSEAPGRPVFPSSLSPPDTRGWRARGRCRRRFKIRISLRKCGSASRRATRTSLKCPGSFAAVFFRFALSRKRNACAGPRFPGTVLIGGFPRSEAASTPLPGLPSFLTASPARRSAKPQRPHRQPAPGGRLILATRRSPGAARVRGRSVRLPPAGAASGSIIRRLMMTPLDRAGRNVTTIL